MVLAAPVTGGLGLAAAEVEAEAAVAAPAAVAAIPEAAAEDRHATRHATAALVPVPKTTTVFPSWCYTLLFLPLSFQMSAMIFNFCILCPNVVVDEWSAALSFHLFYPPQFVFILSSPQVYPFSVLSFFEHGFVLVTAKRLSQNKPHSMFLQAFNFFFIVLLPQYRGGVMSVGSPVLNCILPLCLPLDICREGLK